MMVEPHPSLGTGEGALPATPPAGYFRSVRASEPAAVPGGPGRLVAFDHCRILLPQFKFLRRPDPVSRLHRLSFSDPVSAARAGTADVFLAQILFALVVARQLSLYLLHYGAYVAQHHGVGRWRQFRDLWYCAWRQNQCPRHYYWRKLFLQSDRTTWPDYLEHRQVNTLMDHLNRHLPITRATNKFLFYHHCLAHRLPTPVVHAAWTDRGRLITAVPMPRAHDLFVKPVTEYGSVGTMVIPYDTITRTHRLGERDLGWPELLTELAHHAQMTGQSLVLQRRIRNAPRNAIFGTGDICNLRIVTAHPPGGGPEAIAAFNRLPSSLTTTGHDRHVLIASVDIGTGRMSAGKFREITKGEFPFHPDTGAAIAGQILPGWPEMLALALRAHATFPWLPFVGWDVIDTGQGVMLLEANAYWGADAVQLPGATPIGRTRFPEIYLEWFDRFNRSDATPSTVRLPATHDQNLEPSRSAADLH